MRHLLGIQGLRKEELLQLLSDARSFVEVSSRDIKKVPALRGKTVINLFMEPSTRTRTSFEIAGKRLSADTINLTGSSSSVVKGETLLDTARNLEAMAPDVLVVRHKDSGAPHFLAQRLHGTAVVNAGDGMHEHPTQALLDCLSLLEYFEAAGRKGIAGLRVAIVGDIRHSRVARSNIWAHRLLGNDIRLVGPPTLLPPEFAEDEAFGGLALYHDLRAGLEGADVVMALRMQLERMEDQFVPSLEEYCSEFGINEAILREVAPDSVILHPGPINRGVEISSEVADGPRSLISRQVANGVAVRMAVLFSLALGRGMSEEADHESTRVSEDREVIQ